MDRNTSTYVEKIQQGQDLLTLLQKHLHIRGENVHLPLAVLKNQETPPHTWRKFHLILIRLH